MKKENKLRWKLLVVAALALLGAFFLRVEKAVYAEEYVVSVPPGCGAKEIQEALDKNANGQYDKLIVEIPAGTYYLNTTLYIYSNTMEYYSDIRKNENMPFATWMGLEGII